MQVEIRSRLFLFEKLEWLLVVGSVAMKRSVVS